MDHEGTTRRQRPAWAPRLDALLDLDLHLTPTTGGVLVLPSEGSNDLVDAFVRASVHSVGRHDGDTDRGSPLSAALRSLADALPHRTDLRALADPTAMSDHRGFVAQLTAASKVHPFCLVLDHPTDEITWSIVVRLADPDAEHGLLVLVATDDIARRDAVGRVVPAGTSPMPATHPAPMAVTIPATEVSDLVLLLALHPAPMSVTRLARVLGADWMEVDGEVTTWEERGVVARVSGRSSTVEIDPVVDRSQLISGITADRRRSLHMRLARELTDDDGVNAASTVLADAIAGARHALAGGEDIDLIVCACTAAAQRCMAAGSLSTALDILQQAIDAGCGARDRMSLLTMAGHIAGRLGLAEERRSSFDAALAIARQFDDIELVAQVTAAATLTASQVHGSGEELRRLLRLLEQFTDRRPDIRAMLLMRQAEIQRLLDPAECRRAVNEALEVARECGDEEIEARALRIASILSSEHPMARDLHSVVSRLDELSTPTASVVAAYLQAGLCQVAGDRVTLDALVAQYRVALREHPMALWEPDVEGLRAVQALHDADRDSLLEAMTAMRDIAKPTGAMGGYWTYALQLLWYYVSGENLPFEEDPEIPVPTQGKVRDLLNFAFVLVAVEMGDLGAIEQLAVRSPEPSSIIDGEWTTPTWLPLMTRAAYHTGNRTHAAALLDRTVPHVAGWVLLGVAVPIGPVGFFIADTQRMLGRTTAAMASCEAGLQAALRMRSQPWIARCSLQKARYLHADGLTDDAQALLDMARRIAKVHRLAPIVKECDELAGVMHSVLSGPELEALRLVTEGMANKQIASHLGVSVKRVERLLSSAYRRLGVQNRAEAVRTMLSTYPQYSASSTSSS